MATGFYGINRPADVDPSDVDVVVLYSENRETTSVPTVNRITDASTVLTQFSDGGEDIQGLYNLRLSSDIFSQLGVYNVYVKPREINLTIDDCGILFSQPNVKGIIINLSQVNPNDRPKFVDNGLTGYRVEYFDTDGSKIRNFYRVITSNFYCEPVLSNLPNVNQKAIRYRYTSVPTDLVFCTVTPSTAPTNNLNSIPFIGEPGQSIKITNTFFDSLHMEVEMVEHDAQTLSYALYGNQIKSLEDGVYTIYDNDGNVFKQYQLYEVRNEINEKLYEVRENRGDESDDTPFDTIINEE